MRYLIKILWVMVLSIAACNNGGGGTLAGTVPLNVHTADAVVAAVLTGGGELEGVREGVFDMFDGLDLSGEGTFGCPGGGHYSVDLNGNPPTSGALYFEGCLIFFDGDVNELNGTIGFALVDDDTVELKFDITAEEGDDTRGVLGDLAVGETFGPGAAMVETMEGDSLTISENARSYTIEDYRIEETIDLATNHWSQSMRCYLRSDLFAGSVYVETLVPLEGDEFGHPEAGTLILRGAFGTQIRIILMGETIQFEVDADGDGIYETQEITTWNDIQ